MPDGWQIEPRPVSPELTTDFTAPPYDPTLPHEHDHISGWASFPDLVGEDGLKKLMKSVR